MVTTATRAKKSEVAQGRVSEATKAGLDALKQRYGTNISAIMEPLCAAYLEACERNGGRPVEMPFRLESAQEE